MSIPPIPPVPTGASPAPVATPAPTIPLRPLGGGLGGGLKIAGSRGLATKPLTLQQPDVPGAPVPPPLPGAPRPPAIPSAFTPPMPPAGATPTVPIGAGLRPPMAPPTPAQQAAYNAPSVALNPTTMPMQSAVPTAVMPSATVSLTPTIGLTTSQQGGTRPNSVNTMDMEEEPKENTFLLALSITAAVLAFVFCLFQYNIDQLPHRVSIGIAGDPLAVPTTEVEEEYSE